MILVITEKKSVADDFKKSLNNKYFVIFTNGHLFNLASPEYYNEKYKYWDNKHLPILPNSFSNVIINKELLNNIIKNIKNIVIDSIIIATDAGREGELIARELLHFLFNKYYIPKNIPIKRFWTSSALTKDVIITNISKCRNINYYDKYYFQALYREYIDWIIGINFSRYFSVINKKLFSFGRIQTALLKYIYDNALSIVNFNKTPYYKYMVITNNNIKLFLYNKDNNSITFNNKVDLDNLSFINNIISLSSISNKKYTEKPPLLPNLTTIQKFAFTYFKYKPDFVLNIMQKLYEDFKVISYPRSSSRYINSDNIPLLLNIYNNVLNISISNVDHLISDNDASDHHAVICLKDFYSDDVHLFRIYNIIKFFMLSAIDDSHIYTIYDVFYIYNNNIFKTSLKYINNIGWHKHFNILNIYVDNFKNTEDDNTDEYISYIYDINSIPKYLNIIDENILSLYTQPPKRYNITNILNLMEKYNLGTEATRSSIINILYKRKYVFDKNNRIHISDIGISYIKYLLSLNNTFINELLDYKYTSSLEDILCNSPETAYKNIYNNIKLFFSKIV